MLSIALLVQGEVVCMLHDPLAVWRVLPGQDRLGRVYSNIIIVGYVASKEVDLHDLFIKKFIYHRKNFRNNFRNRFCYFYMFLLSTIF